MPTIPGAKSSTPLNSQQTLEKVTSLITELGDDTPAPDEAAEQADKAPVESVASEQAPPETSDKPDAPEAEDETPIEVKVDGEPVQVSLAELKRNYSSQAHNTQRAQELSEREKRLEPEIRARVEQELQDVRLRYLTGLQQLDQALGKLEGEPDWVKRRTELSPDDFLKEKADWEANKAARDQLRRHAQEEAQAAQAAQVKQHHEYLRGEQDKLVAAIPEWKDTAKGRAEIDKLATFVRTKYGFSAEQVAQGFQTAGVILAMRDAYRYAELHREPNPAQRKGAGIKPAKPGTPDRPRPDAERQRILDSTRSGRSRDAASAIEKLLLAD